MESEKQKKNVTTFLSMVHALLGPDLVINILEDPTKNPLEVPEKEKEGEEKE